MTRKPLKSAPVAYQETGIIRKNWGGRIRVALIYPNAYHVGMSSLGFQTVYRLFNELDPVVCERVFLPEAGGPVLSVESGRPLGDFDAAAVSVSYESDYPNLLTILAAAGIPFRSSDRDESHPLIMAGGVACFLNPEPIAEFVDCFLLGEAEEIAGRFFDVFDPGEKRHDILKRLARDVPGVYVPAFYETEYHQDGAIRSFHPVADAPDRVRRMYLADLSQTPTCSSLLTPDTPFADTFLVETGRGCPHGCRFCSAGYVYRPPRFRPVELLKKSMLRGAEQTDRIGLLGAAVSDLPGLSGLCAGFMDDGLRISFSSLRADALSPELIRILRKTRVKTATIAPDAGSERMRRVINKGIGAEDVLNAAESLVAGGIPNLKLYFMIGLPTESSEDVSAIVDLCKQIKHRFLKSSQARGRIGGISISLNCFVPKPMTPFQWVPMEDMAGLKQKIKKLKTEFNRIPNVRLHHDIPRHAYVQALLSRGDRRVSRLLSAAHQNGGNWPQTFKESQINPDYYVHRHRAADEILPWDFIDHGVEKSFLWKEYQQALKEKPSPVCPMKDGCDWCGACGVPQASIVML
jgi:radical SAM family uncharacterized protein